jgi:two-component system, cell cycle sensor histidine kinase and response regulator CckA
LADAEAAKPPCDYGLPTTQIVSRSVKESPRLSITLKGTRLSRNTSAPPSRCADEKGRAAALIWQYSDYGVFSMAAAVVSAAFAVVTWRRRPTPGATAVSCLLFLVTAWSIGYAFELWSADLPSKLIWNDMEYPAIVTIPWLWLLFVLEYTGRNRWIRRRNVAFAAVIPVITIALVWANSSLVYTSMRLESVNGVTILAVQHGAWWWVSVCYSYLPLIVSAVMLLQCFVWAPSLYRGQVAALLLGAFAPWLAQILYASGMSPLPHLEITPFAFIFTGAAAFLGFFRFRLLDITPVPRVTILEAIGDGMIVTDARRRIVHMNQAAQQIIGASAARLLGKPVSESQLRSLNLPLDPDDAGEYRSEITLDKEGLPRHYDLRVTPLRDTHAKIKGHLAMLRDTTARKEMEHALRESEERYRGLVESQTDLIVRVDPEGMFTFVNDACCRTFGKTAEELYGRPFMEFVHEDDHAHTLAAMASLTVPPYRVNLEQRALTVDGWRWLSWEDYALRDQHGHVVEIQGVARDITESREAEEARLRLEARLRHSQKLESLGVLAGGIAHDFNNLLMGVLGQADLVLADLEPSAPVRDGVEKIKLAAHRAANLTRQMLAYSGKGSVLVQPIDLSTLVDEISRLLSASVSKNALLEYHFASDLPAVEGDPDQLRQIVMNLITNASDAVGEMGGVIRISTGILTATRDYLSRAYVDDSLLPGEYVYLEIADSGCGMDEDTRARMFDPFFTTKFTGRGLGLAAVLGIVRGHRGAILVESEVGNGTTFRVLFPASVRRVVAPSEPAKAEDAREGATVLVVDDDEIIRGVATRMLERGGYAVVTAQDGLEGVSVFRERRGEISAVLLDTMMPRMGGREALLEMRRIWPEVPVVVMSGYSEQEMSLRFADTRSVAGFIQKPYGSAELLAKLAQAIGTHDGPGAPSYTPVPSSVAEPVAG